jgi:hypothetical protein
VALISDIAALRLKFRRVQGDPLCAMGNVESGIGWAAPGRSGNSHDLSGAQVAEVGLE